MPPHEIVKMGVCHVPEGRRVFPALSVKDNLLAGTVGNPRSSKADIERLYEEVLPFSPCSGSG